MCECLSDDKLPTFNVLGNIDETQSLIYLRLRSMDELMQEPYTMGLEGDLSMKKLGVS